MPDLPERKEVSAQRTFVVETGKINETQAEKEGLVKRIWDLELVKPVSHQGQVLVSSPTNQKPKIVLPLSKSIYLNPANWHKPVVYALRWLLSWAQRIIKMHPQETFFQKT